MKKFYAITFLLIAIFLINTKSFSQISLTGSTYTQDFNTLANTGTSSTLPTGWLLSEAGTNANTTYTAGNGSGTGGDTYSFGATSSADRAFGGLQSGALIPTIGAFFTNNTGSTVTSLTINYTGEQWRLGATSRIDQLDFQYSLDATSLTTGTWTDVNSLDFVAPVQTGVIGALDGNVSPNRTAISFTIAGLSIPNGSTFYIRWNDLNAAGSDDGLGVDDFSLATGTGVSASLSLAAGANASEPSTIGSFTATFSPATTGSTTFNYNFTGTATFSTDYSVTLSIGSPSPLVSSSGTITVGSGVTSLTFTITPVNDLSPEPTETINLAISNPSGGYTLGTSSASINLLDDDITPISLTGIYLQNFDALLVNTGTGIVNSLLPNGWGFSENGTSANTTYTAGTGSSNTGDTYSFGATSNSDRAFGGLQSGSLIPTIGAAFTNNTGTTITSLRINYNGEEWRLGTQGRTDQLDFQYSTNATGLTTGTWTDVNQLDFVTPNTSAIVGALDGNAAANRTAISFAITGVSIPNGTTFFIRWNDANATGADDGLGIDDFSIEPNPSDPNPPVITTLFPANNATNVATNLTAVITFNETIQKGTGNIVIKKTSDNSVVQTIDVATFAVTVSSTTASFNLSGLAQNAAYYIEVSAGAFKDLANNNFAGITGNSTWAFTTGNVLYSANFNTCTSSLTDGFTQFSAVGPQVWACTAFGRDPNNLPSGSAPNGVQINGFNVTNIPNEDWLISPAFDLTSSSFPLLSFWSRTKFNGAPLQLKVSIDYPGTGDPRSFTWTDLNGKFPAQTSDVWTQSSNINLSAFKNSNVHVAFVYFSSDEDGARWTLDDINLTNSPVPPPPSLTVSTTDIQFNYVASGSTADKTFTFIGNDITSNVSLNATGNFTLSKDGISFSSSLLYTIAEANNIQKTVFVRFAPNVNDQNFTGTISISTSPLSAIINLKGSSIDPATTLEVVNWNLEWFGSTTLGPPNDNQQEQNVKTIMQNIGADIFGLVEVVDTARLGNIVRSMPGYTYVVGNFGSHVNPPDPSGGPISEAQKLAFVYKTSLFSNVSVRPLINNQNIASTSYNNWASGRYPLLMKADVTLRCVTKTVYFVLIHAKANTAPTNISYDRRKAAVTELHDTLSIYFSTANVILLGDFNDDLDSTITDGISPRLTSYISFRNADSVNYPSPTLALSYAGKKSTVSFSDVIDHVILSKQMQNYYMTSTANVLTDVANLVTNYGSTTTDHYPVFTRYRFEAPAPPFITSCPTVPAFCKTSDNMYTIPLFTATSPCGNINNYSFSISGATSRTGNTNNASGIFNVGTSTITWTAADALGVTSTCQTTVIVNANPMVTIPDAFAMSQGVLPNTVYIGYAPASSITLTSNISGGLPNYTYSWSNGSTSSSTTVSPIVNTTYTLTVTDANGCHGTANKNITVIDIRGGNKLDKVVICHKGGTITVDGSAVQAHLNHGDMLASCSFVPTITSKQPIITENVSSKLDVTALPNPSNSYFNISLKGNNSNEKISMIVTDALGRVIEQRDNLSNNQVYRIGNNYKTGLYFIEFIQGREKVSAKLLKL